MAEREGSDMPAAGLTRPGAQTPLPSRWRNWRVRGTAPSVQQRGKGWSLGCPFALKGSEREPNLTHMSMVGMGAGVRIKSLLPRGRGYQSTAPSKFP